MLWGHYNRSSGEALWQTVDCGEGTALLRTFSPVGLTMERQHNTIGESRCLSLVGAEVRMGPMKVSLDRSACIGCGVCTQISPECFTLDENAGTAKLLREETDDPSVKEAEDSCPVSCIRVE